MRRTVWCIIVMAVFSLVAGLQAGDIALWDFEEAIDGQYGVESLTQTVDSVSSLIAVPAGSYSPVYVRGADGVGHGTALGILKVAGDDSLLSGFTQFKISFDARLHATPTGTQALLRYGVTKTAWNIYTGTDGKIRILLYDADGISYSLGSSSVMPAGDGLYHHYEFIWNGYDLFIRIDDELDADTTLDIDSIGSTDGNGFLGIGGIVRETESTSQYFNGFIDNVKIEGSWDPKSSAVAAWDFEEGVVGNDLTQSVDSVTGLVASVEAASSANPQYVTGNGGGAAAGFGDISGVLGVPNTDGVLRQKFTKLAVSFDVDLTASNTAATVLLRNGHVDMPFNIYVTDSNEIGVMLMNYDGTASSSIYTSGDSPALDPDAGWQSVDVVWDGDAVYISVDGELLGYKEDLGIVGLALSDAPMGIGGLIRNSGSVGQFLPGSIDNIEIFGYAGVINTDADNDGMSDVWENTYFGGVTNAVASEDDDSDGYSNLEEYILGTHPLDAGSRLEFSVVDAVDGMSVKVSTVSGRSYAVQYRELLTSGEWLPLAAFDGTDSEIDAGDTSGASMRFYRVLVDYAE